MMLTPYTAAELGKKIQSRSRPYGGPAAVGREVERPRHFENSARRNVRLKAARSIKRANDIAAYLAERQRESGRTEVADIVATFEDGAGI